MMELWNPFLAAKKNQQMCDNPTIPDCYMTQKICDNCPYLFFYNIICS